MSDYLKLEPRRPTVATLYLAMNELGEWTVSKSSSDAREVLRDDYDGDLVRVVQLEIDITAALPVALMLKATTALPQGEGGPVHLVLVKAA